jgi:HEAT repeat protein
VLEAEDDKGGAVVRCAECGRKMEVPPAPKRRSAPTASQRPRRRPQPDEDDEPVSPRSLKSPADRSRNTNLLPWLLVGGGSVAVLLLAGILALALSRDKKPAGGENEQAQRQTTYAPVSARGSSSQEVKPSVDVASNPTPADAPSAPAEPNILLGRSRGGLDAQTIVRRLLKSSVWVVALGANDAPISWGSGSLIDRQNGLVLTNFHVVHSSPRRLAILFPDYDQNGNVISVRKHYLDRGSRHDFIPGKSVIEDNKKDLALIQLEKPLPSGVYALRFAAKEPAQGTTVHALGNPGNSGACFGYIPGQVRSVYPKQWLAGGEGLLMNLDAWVIETNSATNHGDSGGPLVNDRAELVGVVEGGSSAANSISLFIAGREARALIERYFQRIGKAWVQETEEPPDLAVATEEDVASIPVLVQGLRSKASQIRCQSAEALGRLGPRAQVAIPSLVETLRDEDLLVRRMTTTALQKIGTPAKNDLRLLIQVLQDGNIEVRAYAAGAIGLLQGDGKSAVPALLRATEDADSQVRANAIASLGKVGAEDAGTVAPALRKLLKDTDGTIRMAAQQALYALGKPAKGDLPLLKQALQDGSADLRIYAATALGQLGPQASTVVPELIQALKHEDKATAAAAAAALGKVGADAKSAVPGLMKALQDDDVKLSHAAAEALVRMSVLTGKDLPALRSAFKSASASVRSAVLLVASSLGDNKDALSLIDDGLSDRDQDVRRQAARILSRLAPELKEVLPRLMTAVKDADPDVRKSALVGLAKFGSAARQAAPLVVAALRDKDKAVVGEAIQAMTVIGPGVGPQAQKAGPNLVLVLLEKENRDLAPQVFEALLKLGKSGAYPLGELLQHEDKEIRLGAAKSLGKLGSEAASLAALRIALQRALADPDPAVRGAAKEAMTLIWH